MIRRGFSQHRGDDERLAVASVEAKGPKEDVEGVER